jgi:hypothetical protein
VGEVVELVKDPVNVIGPVDAMFVSAAVVWLVNAPVVAVLEFVGLIDVPTKGIDMEL